MLTISKINFTQPQNPIKRTTNYSYNKQMANDTISFGSIAPKTPKLPDNFGEVIKDKLFRGALPFEKEHFEALKQKGIKIIVSLVDQATYPNEEKMAKEAGMELVHLNFPKQSDLSYYEALIKNAPELDSLMQKGAVFVHCELGRARTGNMIATYQYLVEKMSKPDIIAQARKYGSNTVDMCLNIIDTLRSRANKTLQK